MPKRKILIVEDDHELRQLLVDLCDVLSLATVTTNNVAEARKILRRERVSEVITDSLQGDWKQLVRLVRKQVGNIPITLWTADTQYQQSAERLRVCFVDQNCFELLPLVNQTSNGEKL